MASAVGALGGWNQLQAFRAPFQARGGGENSVGYALAGDAVAYAFFGSWSLGTRVFKENPRAEIGQWPLPGGPSAKGKEFGHYIAVHMVLPAIAKNPDAGWQWMVHDSSPQGQKYIQWSTVAFDMAAIPGVANDPESLKVQPWRKRANELMAEAKHPSYFPHPGSDQIGAAVTAVIQPFLRGEEGPKTTMENLKRETQRTMDQFRAS
jgi:ABC-type glycerol-3-phosphate transport system substrate-binding protein